MNRHTPESGKRLMLAVFLSVFFILVYGEMFIAPNTPPQAVKSSEQTVEAASKPVNLNNKLVVTSSSDSKIAPIPQATSMQVSNAAILNAKQIRVESPLVSSQLSLLGGRLVSYQLKEHYKELRKRDLVQLVLPNESNFPLGVKSGSVQDSNVMYNLVAATEGSLNESGAYKVPTNSPLVLKLQGSLADGRSINKIISFYSDSYIIDLTVELSAKAIDGKPLELEWLEYEDPKIAQVNYNPKTLTVFTQDQKVERLQLAELEEQQQNFKSTWLGIGDNYFLSALIADSSGLNSTAELKKDIVYFRVESEEEQANFRLFLGPKTELDLNKAGYQLVRSIDLGWFGFIGQPILICIRIFYGLLGNYGLAIVLFTILLKAALLPLTKTSFKSMKAMQELQPEMQALRERIKDQSQLQQEIMALYKRKGVNPMGGCLPMLLQIPVFLGMYNALRSSIDLRHTPFALWINDLAAPEHLDVFGIPVPVMIILMGISMFLQQALTPTAADPAQKKMMLMMPVVFTVMFIVFPFPAGLVLYWLVNNLISIIQQATLRSDTKINPMQATGIGGLLIFSFAWIITLI